VAIEGHGFGNIALEDAKANGLQKEGQLAASRAVCREVLDRRFNIDEANLEVPLKVTDNSITHA